MIKINLWPTRNKLVKFQDIESLQSQKIKEMEELIEIKLTKEKELKEFNQLRHELALAQERIRRMESYSRPDRPDRPDRRDSQSSNNSQEGIVKEVPRYSQDGSVKEVPRLSPSVPLAGDLSKRPSALYRVGSDLHNKNVSLTKVTGNAEIISAPFSLTKVTNEVVAKPPEAAPVPRKRSVDYYDFPRAMQSSPSHKVNVKTNIIPATRPDMTRAVSSTVTSSPITHMAKPTYPVQHSPNLRDPRGISPKDPAVQSSTVRPHRNSIELSPRETSPKGIYRDLSAKTRDPREPSPRAKEPRDLRDPSPKTRDLRDPREPSPKAWDPREPSPKSKDTNPSPMTRYPPDLRDPSPKVREPREPSPKAVDPRVVSPKARDLRNPSPKSGDLRNASPSMRNALDSRTKSCELLPMGQPISPAAPHPLRNTMPIGERLAGTRSWQPETPRSEDQFPFLNRQKQFHSGVVPSLQATHPTHANKAPRSNVYPDVQAQRQISPNQEKRWSAAMQEQFLLQQTQQQQSIHPHAQPHHNAQSHPHTPVHSSTKGHPPTSAHPSPPVYPLEHNRLMEARDQMKARETSPLSRDHAVHQAPPSRMMPAMRPDPREMPDRLSPTRIMQQQAQQNRMMNMNGLRPPMMMGRNQMPIRPTPMQALHGQRSVGQHAASATTGTTPNTTEEMPMSRPSISDMGMPSRNPITNEMNALMLRQAAQAQQWEQPRNQQERYQAAIQARNQERTLAARAQQERGLSDNLPLDRSMLANFYRQQERLQQHQQQFQSQQLANYQRQQAAAAYTSGQIATQVAQQAARIGGSMPEANATIDENAKCENCGKEANFMCSACKGAHYCSEGCQRNQWNNHVKKCNQDGATSGKK